MHIKRSQSEDKERLGQVFININKRARRLELLELEWFGYQFMCRVVIGGLVAKAGCFVGVRVRRGICLLQKWHTVLVHLP